MLDDKSINDFDLGLIMKDKKKPLFIHNYSKEESLELIKKLDSDYKKLSSFDFFADIFYDFIYSNGKIRIYKSKPRWLLSLEKKCNNEPNKLHILYFSDVLEKDLLWSSRLSDLLTIFQSRKVEDDWNLPENVRIVVACDEFRDDNYDKNLLLFCNKFNHVYFNDNGIIYPLLNRNVNSRILFNEIKTGYKIDPFFITFLAYKGSSCFNYPKLINNGRLNLKILDKIFDLIYLNGDLSEISLLGGKELLNEFVSFCGQKVISLDDVIKENYNAKEISYLNTKQKYYLIAILSYVDNIELEKVISFIDERFPEMHCLFDFIRSNDYDEILNVADKIEMIKYDSIIANFIENEYHLK